jgi:predicted nucleic acid-binding protein
MAPPVRRLSVLETSFWIAAHRAEVVANCLDLFDIVVPSSVEEEILSRQAGVPRREYPYATLYRHLRPEMHDPPCPAPETLSLFGRGEAAAIPIAQYLSALLLVNERRAIDYALVRGIDVLTVPAFVVALQEQGIISHRAALRKLELIEPMTAPTIIAAARRSLRSLSDG